MTVLTARPPPAIPITEPSDHPPLRLSLKPPDAPSGLLDGAWWPRSRDLTRELPALTDVLEPLWGRVTRVTVNPTYWPVAPRKVPVNGHVVKVGWLRAEQDPHQLSLLSYHIGRWDLLIIPPETDAAAAARLMAAACALGADRTGSALIADEPDRHADRPAPHRSSRLLPGRRGTHSPRRPQPGSASPPAVRDHRDGGRGRLRSRRRINTATRGRRT
ncbi:DUF5994 family protein [Streptomyces sp. NPDC016845]|uniref:DUF5994 family protein n=1 Tax=Streptomyces sp. NPDC016845 TaxID=3364972 RepID=UPI0037922221